MTNPGLAPADDASTPASDSMQAAYFRGVLADQRAVLAAEIARQTHRLGFMTAKTDSIAISRLRRELRRSTAEHRDLDRMIEALDRRFVRHWGNQP